MGVGTITTLTGIGLYDRQQTGPAHLYQTNMNNMREDNIVLPPCVEADRRVWSDTYYKNRLPFPFKRDCRDGRLGEVFYDAFVDDEEVRHQTEMRQKYSHLEHTASMIQTSYQDDVEDPDFAERAHEMIENVYETAIGIVESDEDETDEENFERPTMF